MILFAKPDETLLDHTRKCISVLDSMRCKEFYDLVGGSQFYECTVLSLALHDVGKAAEGFQKYIRALHDGKISNAPSSTVSSNSSSTTPQVKRWGYRHEILSMGLLMALDFGNLTQLERDCALAILTHHKDIDTLWQKFSTCPRDGPGFENYRQRIDEFAQNLTEVIDFAHKIAECISHEHPLAAKIIRTIPDVKDSIIDAMVKQEDPFSKYVVWFRNLDEDDDEYSKIRDRYLLLKGIVTSCDHLASAGLKSVRHLPEDSIFCKYTPTESQQWASMLKGSGILIAPTGSGKTEAALLWAQHNLRPCRKILYTLPTIASINRMYLRLRDQFSKGRTEDFDLVSMLHHRALFFLYSFYSDEEYVEAGVRPHRLANVARKIYSPIKITTPFQPLKALFGVKGYERGFLELTGTLAIIDEIHAYDPRTIAHILFMLQTMRRFGSDIFVMSATMPMFLRELLFDIVGIPRANFMVDQSTSEKFRHIVHVLPGDIHANRTRMLETADSKRTLIVCNTVRTAMTIYDYFKENYYQGKVGLIHGRFTLRDRIRHEAEIDKFSVLIATQAIEVSLDIDFDTIFTEPAPIDALLQRFGRVNRRGRIQEGADVYVFQHGSKWDRLIYTEYSRVTRTVDHLNELSKNGGLVLTEGIARELVERVYHTGLTENEKAIFDMALSNLRSSWNSLHPFERGHSDKYYDLFDSIEIIPLRYEQEVEELVAKGEKWRISEFLVTLPKPLFWRMAKLNLITRMVSSYPLCDVGYDEELGLRTDWMKDMVSGGDAFIF